MFYFSDAQQGNSIGLLKNISAQLDNSIGILKNIPNISTKF